MVAVVTTPESGSVSVDVELTWSEKSAPEPAGGVTVSPSSCATLSVQLPSPLSVPADRLAPTASVPSMSNSLEVEVLYPA